MTAGGEHSKFPEDQSLAPGALRDLARDEVDRLALLASLSERLNREGITDSVLESVVTTLVKTFSAERGKLHLFGGPEVSIPRPEISEGPFRHSQTVVENACNGGDAVLSFDAIGDVSLADSHSLRAEGILSVVCCPLVGMEANLGWLYMDSRTTTGVFSENDLEMLKVVADVLGAALERSRYLLETEEKSRRLESALEELREANRAKSEFIFTMSHELLTPLAAVMGYGKLLKRKSLGPELSLDQTGFVDQILASSQQLATMVSDVITLTQLESGSLDLQTQACDIGELLNAVVDSFKDVLSEKQIDIKVALGPPPITWRVDAERLKDVIRHLIDNAIKFSSSGGTVKVALAVVQDTLQFQVQDRGVGIPLDAQSRIFERFSQIDSSSTRNYGGLGLGLALVKKLVDRHSGTVTVRSSGVKGEGSVFRVVIPDPNRPVYTPLYT